MPTNTDPPLICKNCGGTMAPREASCHYLGGYIHRFHCGQGPTREQDHHEELSKLTEELTRLQAANAALTSAMCLGYIEVSPSNVPPWEPIYIRRQ